MSARTSRRTSRRRPRSLVATALAALVLTGSPAAPATARPPGDAGPGAEPPPARAGRVVVGSKNFAENRLLAEMMAQLLEARTGLTVDRRLGLAGTQVCFEALRTGAIDLYPEYTGTGLASILDLPPEGGAAATLTRVRAEFLRRWDLHWLAPLGFENAYEIAVPRRLAEERDLVTVSDLAAVAGDLDAAFGYEFTERPDGLPGLAAAYGFELAKVEPMQQAIKYRAAAAGEADVIDVYTTDGRLLTYDLVVLEDDRGFFPPYEAAPLIRGATLDAHPQIAAALALLAGSLDEEGMRQLNLRLQEGEEEEPQVARDALVGLGLVAADAAADEAALETADGRRGLGLPAYLWSRRGTLAVRTGEHLALAAAALLLGVLVAVPLGLALERRRGWAEGVIRTVGLTQTIPSLALLAFMIPLLGVGPLPAVVALWIYSLFPILRNTYTGVRDADPEAVGAALALGMTPRQTLIQVRLPLAAPTLMAGVRTAAVLTVGTATLAAFIGAGGLGRPIVTGLQLADTRMILSGAIPAALLALAVDALLGWVERRLAPAGLD